MNATNELELLIGVYDDFLLDCLEAGAPSQIALLRSLCDLRGRYDFRGSGEAERIVKDFCERYAPELPVYRLNFWAALTKVLAFVVLSVLGYYRVSFLISMIPKPYQSVVCSVILVSFWLLCVLGPRIRVWRLGRVSGSGNLR
jgi:hypothetical protein